MSPVSLSVLSTRILLFCLFFASFSAFSQRQKKVIKPRTGSSIIDDSTKNVYGPTTTLWTTEKDLFENRPDYRPLDTAVNNYHRWTHVQRFNNFYKDLGNMGTALSPIFPLVPNQIGASSGFQAYEPYYTTEEPKYFDTKSPYSRMYLIWGGGGRAMTRVEFSRNINPRWNFGFNYRPILVDRQIQRNSSAQTTSHYYDFFSTYKSKDSSYFLLFNFRRMRHRVNEIGGVYNLIGTPEGLFDSNTTPYLVSAESEDYRRNIHLFHQYQFAEALQLYHIADITKQTNGFKDLPASDLDTLFAFTTVKTTDYSTDTYTSNVIFNSTQNEFGIKGNASKFFYSAHYKFRTYDYANELMGRSTQYRTSGTESYIGGSISLKLDSASSFRGFAETNFLEGFYRVEAELQTPWLEGSFKNTLSKPGFMYMMYRGVHDTLNYKFNGISSTEVKGYLKWKTRAVQFWAGGTFNLFANYLFFREVLPPSNVVLFSQILPEQTSGTQSTVAPEIKASVKFFKHFYLRPQFIYTKFISNDGNALKIPEQFANIQLTYENLLFTQHLQLQVGVDFHWQSTYEGLAYSPTLQQFFVQAEGKKVMSPEFPLVDIFVSGKMRRARLFIKYHNLAQSFLGTGYIPTRGYPGLGSILDFGFDFLLFD